MSCNGDAGNALLWLFWNRDKLLTMVRLGERRDRAFGPWYPRVTGFPGCPGAGMGCAFGAHDERLPDDLGVPMIWIGR